MNKQLLGTTLAGSMTFASAARAEDQAAAEIENGGADAALAALGIAQLVQTNAGDCRSDARFSDERCDLGQLVGGLLVAAGALNVAAELPIPIWGPQAEESSAPVGLRFGATSVFLELAF